MNWLRKLFSKPEEYRPPTMAKVVTEESGKAVFENAYGQYATYEEYSESLRRDHGFTQEGER